MNMETQPRKPTGRKAGLIVFAALSVATIALLAAAAVNGLGGAPTDSPVPAYSLIEARSGLIRVEVDTLPSDIGMRAIFEELRDKYTAPGGYWVEINCSTGATSTMDNRLANGRYAIGAEGANRTGLPAGTAEFSVNADRSCPAS